MTDAKPPANRVNMAHDELRKARLAAALRDNLKRRKAQARGKLQASDDIAIDGNDEKPDCKSNR
jgi:hypothetical protein